MAEIFVNQIITEAGYSLIAAATSSNPVEYIGALSNATVPTDPTDRDSYTGRAGQVDAASATDNVARIVASYLNNDLDSPQPVKAIALLGKLSSYPDSNAVVVAYAADPDSEIVLPRSSAPDQITRFAFNLAFNPGSTISVFQTGDATVEDLFRLVSCHRAGQPTVGEAQTILGSKTFEDTVYAGTVQARSATDRVLIASRGASNPCAVSIGWQSSISRNAVVVGGASYGWVFDNQYIKPLVASISQIGTPTESVNKIYAGSLGDSSNRTGTVYATVTNTTVLQTNAISSANDTIALEKTVLPSTPETYNLGSNDNKFNEIHAQSFHGSLQGDATGTFNGSFFGTSYGEHHGDVEGKIPTPTEVIEQDISQNMPVGSIFFATVKAWGYPAYTILRCGSTIVQDNNLYIYVAKFTTDGFTWISDTAALRPVVRGTYKLLSEMVVGTSGQLMCGLLMRVGE